MIVKSSFVTQRQASLIYYHCDLVCMAVDAFRMACMERIGNRGIM